MTEIKAADVAKLRKMTGAGMMDCKAALQETNGDYDAAIDVLRKKGQKIASKRADREATEGAVIAKVSECKKFGVLICLNCETDFVAKNNDFVNFAVAIADLALQKKPIDLEALKSLEFNGKLLNEEIINQTGIIGEKIDLAVYETINAEYIIPYIHPGNKLAALAGFNMVASETLAKDVVMQIAAMNPLSIDKDDMPQDVIDKEIEIGKDQAIQEGKPADMAEKIAIGRLNKFFKESTLLNQQSVKDNKKTILEVLQNENKNLTVVAFKRFTLNT